MSEEESSPLPAEEQLPPSGEDWTRQRVIFLSISAIAVIALLVAVRAVLLPFVLAVIFAYVLTPLVKLGETKVRLPRSASILLVYALALGVVYLGIAAIAPRVFSDSARLIRDAPRLAQTATERYAPRVDQWVNTYLAERPKTPDIPQEPAFVVEERQDGSLAVNLQEGVEIIEETPGHFRLQRVNPTHDGSFQAARLLNEGVERFVRYVQINAVEFVKLGQSMVSHAARGVFMVFMVLMVAGYMMHTREAIREFFFSLAPKMHRPSFDHLLVRVDRGLAGVVRGQLLICVVNGVLSAVGFWLFGLHYWPVLALVAGIMSIIPIFGAILSTVPAVLVGLSQDIWIAVWVFVWVLGIHQVEANFLNPKIIGTSAKIHPVLVVFSLLVGEHFFGIWGALLAVPILSVAQSVFNHFRYGLPDAAPDTLFPASSAEATTR